MRKIRLLERRLLAAATTRAGWKDRDEAGAKAAPKAHTDANANAKRVRLRFIMANVWIINVVSRSRMLDLVALVGVRRAVRCHLRLRYFTDSFKSTRLERSTVGRTVHTYSISWNHDFRMV
jgi:hypothetical protein